MFLRVDKSPVNLQMSQPQHDSRPSIAAWPTPVAAENVLTVRPRLKLPPTINTSLFTEITSNRSGRMSVSPIPSSSKNLSLVGASSPPFPAVSPQHSPRSQQQQYQQQQNENFHDSSKLLSMLKVVAASSSPGKFFFL